MPYIPHTQKDIDAMLATIGADSIDTLFDEIPASLSKSHFDQIPKSTSEMLLTRELQAVSQQDDGVQCFVGAGAYEHHIPAAVWEVASRGEFMTAYTPYQAEASQGTLQLIYEYQTMMAHLMAMDVSNASMYDGATALAETILMAVRCHRKSKSKLVLLPESLHPSYRKVTETIIRHQGIELVTLPFDPQTGTTDMSALEAYSGQDVTALVIPQPNFFGCVESVDDMANWAKDNNAMSVAVVNPVAMALLKAPGHWGESGVDVVCGEGQPLGVPLASGGPYFGFMCCRQKHIRQMPGRLIGRTVDLEGQPGYTLTLQAREQHIRRSKATSNICTNQGLMVTAATIHMAILGFEGLQSVAKASHHNTNALVKMLIETGMAEKTFSAPTFHECALTLKRPVDSVLASLAEEGILGGYSLKEAYPNLDNALLVCATETKLESDLKAYQDAIAKLV